MKYLVISAIAALGLVSTAAAAQPHVGLFPTTFEERTGSSVCAYLNNNDAHGQLDCSPDKTFVQMLRDNGRCRSTNDGVGESCRYGAGRRKS